MTALISTGVARVAVTANWGRWIAACVRCPSALRVVPFETHVACWECATPAELVWPDARMLEGVERLLMMRPDVTTRNWSPGETLVDLLAENVKHGVLDELPEALPGTTHIAVTDSEIRIDALPASPELRRIGA